MNSSFYFKIFIYLIITNLLFSAPLSESENQFVNNPAVERLQQALKDYQQIKIHGGWPTLTLKSSYEILGARLKITGDTSLQYFQTRHGLKANEVLDIETLNELNVSVEDRIQQINTNIEYAKLFPLTFEKLRAEINIPEFKFYILDDQCVIFDTKIIIGKKSRKTPTFKSAITMIEVNPDWTVPSKIAREDILPQLKIQTDEFTKKGFHFYSRKDSQEVDPKSINWSQVDSLNFPYQVIQEKGPLNALGKIKFSLPNPYGVLIHDTPAKELFSKDSRAFSSGCIRIENAEKLAEYLILTHSTMSIVEWRQTLQSKKTKKINLSSALPVYIFYRTAWVTSDGIVHFRNDLYRRFQKK